MIELLARLFIRNSRHTDDPRVRTAYGMLCSAVAITLNILLAAAKFVVGTLAGSVSITADAMNNLSDVGSGALTLVGFRLSGKKPDLEHPFGHGRIEYVCALIVSFIILLMGGELIRSSVAKILHPEPLQFSMTALIVLLASIGVKIWMAVFNRNIGKRINSTAVGAVVMDSVSDTAATTVSMTALILSKFTSVPLDGYMGIVVALFIIATGIGIFKDTMNELLGAPASPETVQEIENDILSYEGVIGVHDLMVHDYGPGRMFASAHVEVPSDCDIMACHDTIDRIERDIKKKFAINIVLHMDPIVVDDEHINALREKVGELIKEVDPRFTMHDFRMVEGPTHTNLIFDLVVPHKYPFTKGQIKELISDKISTEIGENYYAVMTVENSFVEDERK